MKVRCELCLGGGRVPNPDGGPSECPDCLGTGSIPSVQAAAAKAIVEFVERQGGDSANVYVVRDDLPPRVAGQYRCPVGELTAAIGWEINADPA